MRKIQPLIYAILISIGIYIGNINNNSQIYSQNKISNILKMTKDHYVDSINYTELENDAINAILNKLDPHSSYISTKNTKQIEEDMQGVFSGIGVEFNIIEDSIVVVSSISGGPSEKLGIQSGDRIIEVEGEDVSSIGIKNKDVIKRLRGKKGSVVTILVKRRNHKKLIPFTIIRDDIPLYSVDAGIMLTNKIAYIKINRFAATTYDEMMEKANKLKSEGMNKLILDLRGNPGGYLYIANQICDEFLEAGNLIVFTKGRKRNKQESFATIKGSLKHIEIICLINEGSASASEIVSGALQDNDRGLVIGRRSFGKGLVQEQITLHDGSLVRLTTQRYYTPSGRCIQKEYNKNSKEYYLEKYIRDDHYVSNDSLRYTTKNGRTVYGGGGINPDIIIEIDTNLNYAQINTILSKGLINTFCFEKSELLKKERIKKYTDINIDNIYIDFIQYLKQKENTIELKIGKKELIYLKNLMLANISRHLWDNEIYYTILSEEDEYIQRAIREFSAHN